MLWKKRLKKLKLLEKKTRSFYAWQPPAVIQFNVRFEKPPTPFPLSCPADISDTCTYLWFFFTHLPQCFLYYNVLRKKINVLRIDLAFCGRRRGTAHRRCSS